MALSSESMPKSDTDIWDISWRDKWASLHNMGGEGQEARALLN